jgi:hypothetical protein
LDVTEEASGLAANAVTAEENLSPFSSSASRLLFGVAELKKASQLVVIAATAAAEPPLAVELEPPAGVAVTDAAADDDDAVDGVEELEPPLEQAASVAASTRPSTGAR